MCSVRVVCVGQQCVAGVCRGRCRCGVVCVCVRCGSVGVCIEGKELWGCPKCARGGGGEEGASERLVGLRCCLLVTMPQCVMNGANHLCLECLLLRRQGWWGGRELPHQPKCVSSGSSRVWAGGGVVGVGVGVVWGGGGVGVCAHVVE